LSLVKAYESVKIDLHKPNIRANIEKNMKLIADGKIGMKEVLSGAIKDMH
jgi:DNA topoisomerase IA